MNLHLSFGRENKQQANKQNRKDEEEQRENASERALVFIRNNRIWISSASLARLPVKKNTHASFQTGTQKTHSRNYLH